MPTFSNVSIENAEKSTESSLKNDGFLLKNRHSFLRNSRYNSDEHQLRDVSSPGMAAVAAIRTLIKKCLRRCPKFIILNSKFIIFNMKFFIFNTRFIIFNTNLSF